MKIQGALSIGCHAIKEVFFTKDLSLTGQVPIFVITKKYIETFASLFYVVER